ncbi:hypothetical protein M0R72_19960 [Candidatus Pacearchaeota archaeon]|jgi:hypothetical protein|nr:hypothetical protein [Candidatus Pacearchaeota archaeon]
MKHEIDDIAERAAVVTRTSVADVRNCIYSLILDTTGLSDAFENAMPGLESLNSAIEEQKRKQKSIDRIAWRAETQQRFNKGRKFK